MFGQRIMLAGCLWFVVTASQANAEDTEAIFHRAYYLEVEENDLEAAIRLYEEVVAIDGAPVDLVQRARKRLAACREQLRSRDLSRLMPPDVLAYLELRNPGHHLARLLELAGVTELGSEEETAPGGETSTLPLPFLVSPRLLEALKTLGAVESLAISITDIDTRRGIPSGVVVINPGRNDLVPGLVETGLSMAVTSNVMNTGAPVEGHVTFVSPFGSVVVTERLIIAGNPHQLVVDAVERLYQDDRPALHRCDPFVEARPKREDSLLFAFIDAKRVLEKARAAMAPSGELPQEYRIAQAVADIESLRSAALALGTCDQGVFANFQLRLDQDNHALVYHLFRTPSMGREALKAIPAGAAGFLAFGLSEDKPGTSSTYSARSATAQYVTGLDIGSEFFANINHVLAFILPRSPSRAQQAGEIPDIGLIFTAKESGRSQALWEELLGVAAALIGAKPDPVRIEEVDGRQVHVYAFPESIRVCLAALPDGIVLATSKAVLSAAFRAADGNGCVLDDSAFAHASALIPEASKVAMVHAGRAFQIARPFMGIRDAEASQIAAVLKDTTATIFTDETPCSLQATLVIGVPKVGAVIQRALAQRGRPRRRFHTTPARGPGAEAVQGIIARGSEWRYFDGGTDQGTSWRRRDYDDGTWKSGPAPMGYGEDYLATTVGFGKDPDNKYVTTYFRRAFTVARPERFSALRIHLLRDDGAAVFINGTEVVRDNLPAAAAYDDFTPEVIGGEAESVYHLFRATPDILRPGENTIAVEIHQHDGESSDIIFDLALEGVLKNSNNEGR